MGPADGPWAQREANTLGEAGGIKLRQPLDESRPAKAGASPYLESGKNSMSRSSLVTSNGTKQPNGASLSQSKVTR